MRYKSVFTVTFDASSEERAKLVAAAHHQQISDLLRIEGFDTPYDITLDHLYAEGRRDVLEQTADKPI